MTFRNKVAFSGQLPLIVTGILFVFATLFGVPRSQSNRPAKKTGSTQQSASEQICFENRQRKSGINFVLNNSPTEDKPIIDSTLGGVALLDFDNDGFLDVFFTNGARKNLRRIIPPAVPSILSIEFKPYTR